MVTAKQDKNLHTVNDSCFVTWCRLHYSPDFKNGPTAYPWTWSYMSSRFGWQHVMVYCGPMGFRPKLPQDLKEIQADLARKEADSPYSDRWKEQ